MTSENNKMEGSSQSRTLAYRCPYCLAEQKTENSKAGSERSCSQCGEAARVPEAKLTISGKAPLGRKIRERPTETKAAADAVRLSQPDGAEHPSVPIGKPHGVPGTSDGTPAPSFPLGKIMFGILALVIMAAIGIALSQVNFSGPPPTAENALPSEEVVFSEVDFAYQKLRSAEMAIQAVEQDLKVTLGEFKNLAGAESAMKAEIAVIEDAITQREGDIAADLTEARNSIANLVRYHRLDRNYVEELFEQKIQQAESRKRSQQARAFIEMLGYIQKIPSDADNIESLLAEKITYPKND